MMFSKRIAAGVALITISGAWIYYQQSTPLAPSNLQHADVRQHASEFRYSRNEELQKDIENIAYHLANSKGADNLLTFNKFYETYILSEAPDEMLWFYDKYASLLEDPGNIGKNINLKKPHPMRLREEIVSFYNTLNKKKKSALSTSMAGIAKSIYKSTTLEFSELIAIRLSTSDESKMKKQLSDKQARLAKLEKKLKTIHNLKIPKWSIAANYRIANAYMDGADAIRQSYIPGRLSDKQELVYLKTLDKMGRRIENTALAYLNENTSIATQHNIHDSITSESKLLYQRLRIKVCPSDEDIELLHRAIFYTEHPPQSTVNAPFQPARIQLQKLKNRMDDSLEGVKEFRSLLSNRSLLLKEGQDPETYSNTLKADAESLRVAMEEWACLPRTMHDKFHIQLGK